jgi:predicted unusual protein kinase regulating ubiquinone biosynthesis (AarF/ABC1/UbiB family)
MCKACNGVYLKLDECILLFSELADGSAAKYFPLSIKNDKIEELIAMFCQVLMACLTLEKHEIIHGDLHFGNILYHEEEEEKMNTGKYLHYNYNGKHIYVKHLGKLWVLWDFGNMIANNEIHPKYGYESENTLSEDVSRLIELTSNRLSKFIDNEKYKHIYYAIRNIKNNTKGVFDVIKNVENIFGDMIIISSTEIDLDTVDPIFNIKDRENKEYICKPNINIVKSKKMTLNLF